MNERNFIGNIIFEKVYQVPVGFQSRFQVPYINFEFNSKVCSVEEPIEKSECETKTLNFLKNINYSNVLSKQIVKSDDTHKNVE